MNKAVYENIHFRSDSNEWATPQEFYDRLNAIFSFTLDPCATPKNHKTERFFTISDDGLSRSWDNERVFMNPPYGREIGKWVKKASEQKGGLVVCLLPARTDTRWWHEYVVGGGATIKYLKGRLKFGGQTNSAPFPSAIVIFFGGDI